jgi:hypothetical protein
MLTAQQLNQEMQQHSESTTALLTLWTKTVGAHLPAEQQIGVWLDLHPLDRVVFGIRETGRKFLRTKGMTAEHTIRFCSSVMNSAKTRQEEQAA